MLQTASNSTPPTIGQRIKALRTKRGASQQGLADFLHTDKSVICRWEKDDRYPSTEMIQNLAEYFHVSELYLIYGYRDLACAENLVDLTGLTFYQADLVKKLVEEFRSGC